MSNKKQNTVYKPKHRNTQNKIKEAEVIQLNEKCEKIEEIRRKYDIFNVHNKISKSAAFIEDNGQQIQQQVYPLIRTK